MNLLTETINMLHRSGYEAADVVYIGSRDGYSCTWDEFCTLADQEYDSGYGGQEVASDLEIHFKDGGWLDRHEYDGSEGWDYNAPFVLPTKVRPVRKLIKGEDDSSWSDMNDLNGDFA